MNISLNVYAEDYDADIRRVESVRDTDIESTDNLDSLLLQIKGEIDDTQSAVNHLNTQIQENEKFLIQAIDELTEAHDEMKKLEIEIGDLEEKIESRSEQLAEQARKVQVNGNSTSYVDFVLNAESLTDIFARVDLVSKIVDGSRKMLDDQKKDKEAILSKTDEIERKIIQQNALAEKLEETSAELESQKTSQEALALQLEIEKTTVDSERAALIEEQKDALNRVKRLEDERELAQAAAEEAQEKRRNEQQTQPSSSKVKKEVSQKEEKKEKEQVEAVTEKNEAQEKDERPIEKVKKVEKEEKVEKVEKEEKVEEEKKEEIQPSSSKNFLSVAEKYLGADYLYGGRTPDGFDCSGYTSQVFKELGKTLPRTSYGQYAGSTKVKEAVPGDLVFFGKGSVSHVGIYVGNNRFIGSQTSTGVAYARLDSGHWSERIIGYGRY